MHAPRRLLLEKREMMETNRSMQKHASMPKNGTLMRQKEPICIKDIFFLPITHFKSCVTYKSGIFSTNLSHAFCNLQNLNQLLKHYKMI